MDTQRSAKSVPIVPPSRYEIYWPDGSYSICTRQGEEWIVRMPDGQRYGAGRLLTLWHHISEAGGVIARAP